MLKPDFASSFPRDIKRCRKKHWKTELLEDAIAAVVASDEVALLPIYNDHALRGDRKGCRLLHIGGPKSNWILLYKITDDIVIFIRTGTHDEVL
jgi:mRNA interferase YafQ